jgi:hypothetical protein
MKLRYKLIERLIRKDINAEWDLVNTLYVENKDKPELERYWMGRLTGLTRLIDGRIGER